jgi:phosphatidylglycerophosphatase A
MTMASSNTWLLCAAQGLGVGRIPLAPGTFGALLGLAWLAALLGLGSPWWFGAGIVGGFFLSVWLGGHAERILQAKDPPSVVIDEVTAMPLCYASILFTPLMTGGSWATVGEFFFSRHGLVVLAGFVFFRFFDIAKPWPVYASQRLPGGWGITVDDFLAAGYVNAALAGMVWLL